MSSGGLDVRNRNFSGFEIAGVSLGAVTALAAILALFKGWKIWKRKRHAVSLQLITDSMKTLTSSIQPDFFFVAFI